MSPQKGGEFGLIREIQRIFPGTHPDIILGIGDDAAAVETSPEALTLLSTDTLVEHVHFEFKFSSFEQIGNKALQVNLSDIAAMGGQPSFFLVSLGVPPHITQKDLLALYDGLEKASNRAEVDCVGGNVSYTGGPFFISITVMGAVSKNEMITRCGAKAGDALYVTGTLGDAAAGLDLLQGSKPQEGFEQLLKAQCSPVARCRSGRLLAKNAIPSAMIDVSDGLAGDLGHLMKQSEVGALLEVRDLPVSPALIAYASAHDKSLLDFALQGGEAYELLFTVPNEKEESLLMLIDEGEIQATRIGVCSDNINMMQIRAEDGKIENIKAQSFDHLVQ